MTLLCWLVTQNNLATVCQTICCPYFTINKVSNGVVVYGKCTFNGDVICRHCRRYLTPATESVSLLGRYVNQHNLAAIWSWNYLVLLAVNLVDYTVTIHCKATLNNNVICRHCRRCIDPATEGVALFCWFVNQFDFAAVCNAVSGINFAINHVGYSVVVNNECSFYCNILCRHCFGYFAPTTEGMALSCWCFRQCNHFAIFHRDCIINLAVNNKSNSIHFCSNTLYKEEFFPLFGSLIFRFIVFRNPQGTAPFIYIIKSLGTTRRSYFCTTNNLANIVAVTESLFANRTHIFSKGKIIETAATAESPFANFIHSIAY